MNEIKMNYNENEIKKIKLHSFNRGWICGLVFGICIFTIMIVVAIFFK
jgi:hypothetical protein